MGLGYTIDIEERPSGDGTPDEGTAGGFKRRIEEGFRLGPGTNNRAEYLGLIFALRHALRENVTHVRVRMDSLLVVNQVSGRWSCRDSGLKPLCEEARGLAGMFGGFHIEHIPREDNEAADGLSRNPTEDPPPAAPSDELVIHFGPRERVRKVSRPAAAMIRWWYKTRRCRNEYRLARIFGGSPSLLGRIGRGDLYNDITTEDLPCRIRAKPGERSSTPCLSVAG
jgi:ribonuclease HI